MDGTDFTLETFGRGPGDAVRWNRQLMPHAGTAFASQAEIDAIMAMIPRDCRSDAAWAVPLLLDTARNGGISHPRRIAYLLATAHAVARFGAALVERPGDPGNAGEIGALAHYEPGTPLGAAHGNSEPGDGERFRGRGFVYVRGRANYATWSQRLGMPNRVFDGRATPFFVVHPDAMARPYVAAQTLVRGMRDGLFTGIALGSYVNDKKTDYENAHRVTDAAVDAREIAALAVMYAAAIEGVAADHHRAHMQALADRRAAAAPRNFLQDVRDAVERLSFRGEHLPQPAHVVDWNGEARQGKFVQLDERTCALHMGRGTYVVLDVQRDLNGIVPVEGKNMVLNRSGDVRPALRTGGTEFWR